MLPYQHRLTKSDDFALVKSTGRKLQSDSFAFVYTYANTTKPSRFGFVVSTKISKKAVERNRVKRLLRANVERLLKSVHLGFDGVFLVKQSILTASDDKLREEVNQIFKVAGINA